MAKPLISQELMELYRAGKYVSCQNFHFGSCETKALNRMGKMIKFFLTLYGPAHLLPVLIFKLKKLRTDPIPILTHVFQNIVRSVSFGLAVIGVAQYSLCTFNKLFQGTTRLNWLFISSISALPIIIEAESRKGELALYLFPRVLETLWNLMKKKGFPLRIKNFEIFVFGIAMGTLTYFLHNDDKYIKPSYKSSLRGIIFGNN